MESNAKYTEEIRYDVIEPFAEKVVSLPLGLILNIGEQVVQNLQYMMSLDMAEPPQDIDIVIVGGVSHELKEPFFFLLVYGRDRPKKEILFLDIAQIKSDTYLDLYLNNKTLKSNETESPKAVTV